LWLSIDGWPVSEQFRDEVLDVLETRIHPGKRIVHIPQGGVDG
jgi:hypothetical protein